MKLPPFLTLLVLLAAGMISLPARTIEWGNSVGDILVDSNGVALDDSYVFELGSFGLFTPTELNMDQWAANWKAFDRAEAPAAEGWNSAFSYFSSSATLETGGVSSESPPLPAFTFQPGEQAFIWIFNVLDIEPGTEWGLFTNDSLDGNAGNDWLFPEPGDKTDLPLEWRLFDAQSVIYGGLHGEQGAGEYAVDPPAYQAQTHIVPEPSGALLLGLTAIVLIHVGRARRWQLGDLRF